MTAMVKERIDIKVWTRPEGFALEVGGTGYLYDSEGQLLEGMIYHIMLKGKEHRRGRGVRKLLSSFTDKTKIELEREVVAMRERSHKGDTGRYRKIKGDTGRYDY